MLFIDNDHQWITRKLSSIEKSFTVYFSLKQTCKSQISNYLVMDSLLIKTLLQQSCIYYLQYWPVMVGKHVAFFLSIIVDKFIFITLHYILWPSSIRGYMLYFIPL